MVIGISGKYCAGKNAAVDILEKRGFVSIDVDKLGHRVLEEKKETILSVFGPEAVAPGGGIDRKRLGDIVFSDRAALERLESILHPRMTALTREFLDAHRSRDRVINAAILFKMGLHRFCDTIFWITAPVQVRFFRALSRDGFHPIRILRRICAQRGMKPQHSRENVDIHIIDNPGSLQTLEAGIEKYLE
jgi:dephospho-CoA kinase